MTSTRGIISPLSEAILDWEVTAPRAGQPREIFALLFSALPLGKKLDSAGKVGVLIEDIVRLGFGRSTRVTVRAEQDRLHPNLARSKDVAEAVVSNENGLLGADLQFRQGRLKQPGVRLAIAVVTRDDDRGEVVGKAGGPKLG